jgi:hypothetical protein
VAKDGPLAEELALKPSKAKRETLGQINFWQIILSLPKNSPKKTEPVTLPFL